MALLFLLLLLLVLAAAAFFGLNAPAGGAVARACPSGFSVSVVALDAADDPLPPRVELRDVGGPPVKLLGRSESQPGGLRESLVRVGEVAEAAGGVADEGRQGGIGGGAVDISFFCCRWKR